MMYSHLEKCPSLEFPKRKYCQQIKNAVKEEEDSPCCHLTANDKCIQFRIAASNVSNNETAMCGYRRAAYPETGSDLCFLNKTL